LLSESSRHPGRTPPSGRREDVEATARRDVAAREAGFFPEEDVERDVAFRVPVRGVAFTAFLAEPFPFDERAVRREVLDADFDADRAAPELLTKRTGFFARDAVVEEGLRFFEEAMIR
jgi:hypothetical protein